MFIVIRIDVYNCLTKAKTETIMTNQAFSARHQVEQYRSDMEHYLKMRGIPEVTIFFSIKEHIKP